MNNSFQDKSVDSNSKLKFPRSVFFIICTELFESYACYGTQTVLLLYLRNKLYYNEKTSIQIFHIYMMASYFFTIFGATLADSWFGKFRAIYYANCITAIGYLALSASAATPLGLPAGTTAILGLGLTAIGTGGFKPCIAAFGGDQFVLPQQDRYLSWFFAIFTFAIHIGRLITAFSTPILRDVACFGDNTCYSLAYFASAILMIAAFVTFLLGKPKYKIIFPERNVLVDVTKCIVHSIANRLKAKEGEKKEHWLDYADDKFDRKIIEDIRLTTQVLKVLLPLPIFWALFQQQGSLWTIQATRMDGKIGSFIIKPDQMQFLTPLITLAVIPILEFCIYPILDKFNHVGSPLRRIGTGAFLASLSFVIAAVVELNVERTYDSVPIIGLAKVRIYNTMNCPINISIEDESFVLDNLSLWEKKITEVENKVMLDYSVNYADCIDVGMVSESMDSENGTIAGLEGTATSFAVTPMGLSHSHVDNVYKTASEYPAVRALVYINPSISSSAMLSFVTDSKTILSFNVTANFTKTDLIEIGSATYDIYSDNTLVQPAVELKSGGIYVVTAFIHTPNTSAAHINTINNPNSVHMLWLIPQNLLISLAQTIFYVSGMKFVFTEAPASMKTICSSTWYLIVAGGHLIVIIVTELSLFDRQSSTFFLYVGLSWAALLLFAIMAKRYNHVSTSEGEPLNEDTSLKRLDGQVNATFTMGHERNM